MGYKHSKDDLLDAAVGVALDEGLNALSFGRVAKRLGISDRTVVYYFPTKDELVVEVLQAVGARLQVTLGAAFTEPAPDHRALASQAWPVLARPEADPVFAVFFEATGLAAAGRDPYRAVVPSLIGAWVDWLAGHLECPESVREAEANAALALVDGLLLLRQTSTTAADAAATRLLETSPPGKAGTP